MFSQTDPPPNLTARKKLVFRRRKTPIRFAQLEMAWAATSAIDSIEQASLCTAAPVGGDLGGHVYNFARNDWPERQRFYIKSTDF